MDSPDFGRTVETAIRGLTAVSDMSHIRSVPSVEAGNAASHAIGLGQMNLHGYLAREGIAYGSGRAGFHQPLFLHHHLARAAYLDDAGARATSVSPALSSRATPAASISASIWKATGSRKRRKCARCLPAPGSPCRRARCGSSCVMT
jgi:ribonucleoside-diphosphate reductase alpha chain